jgi:hypothetical protein
MVVSSDNSKTSVFIDALVFKLLLVKLCSFAFWLFACSNQREPVIVESTLKYHTRLPMMCHKRCTISKYSNSSPSIGLVALVAGKATPSTFLPSFVLSAPSSPFRTTNSEVLSKISYYSFYER